MAVANRSVLMIVGAALLLGVTACGGRSADPTLTDAGSTSCATAPPPPQLTATGITEVARWQQGPAELGVISADTAIVQVENETQVTAYNLRDGKRRWSQPVGARHAEFYAVCSVAVMTSMLPEDNSDRKPGFSTVAVDRLTGAVRWRADKWTAGAADMVIAHPGSIDPGDLEVHDPTTFALRWTVPDVFLRGFTAARDSLYVVDVSGALTVRDPLTGHIRQRAQVPVNKGDLVGVAIQGGLVRVLTVTPDDDGGVFWFDPQTLAPVRTDHEWMERTDCGPVWCADGASGQTFLLDKITGRTVRTTEDHREGVLGHMLLLDSGGDQLGSPAFAILDPRTDKVRVDLHGWWSLPDRGGAFSPMFVTEPRLLARPGAGETELGAIVADGFRRLGSLPSVLRGCSMGPGVVICSFGGTPDSPASAPSEIGIWRIEP